MKTLLFLILLSAITISISFAKTAVVTYGPVQDDYDTIIWASTEPGIDEATQLVGAIDTDMDGVVEISNISPGKTYYFRARAYDKLTGLPTGWSNELSFDVPAEITPETQGFPPLPVFDIPGFIVDSIIIKPIGD